MQKTFLILLFASFNIFSKNIVPVIPNVKAHQTNETIIIDGVLNENIWTTKSISNFIQREPNEGEPAQQKTNVWVAYDNSYLYIAAKLYDSEPEKIDRALMRRDNLVESDWFFAYLDTYNDDRNGYFFAVNAGGSISDGTYYNDSWLDDSWDGVWESQTSINNDGWSVEIKIPFAQLRFKEADKMTWGINFSRTIKRDGEKLFYKMVPSKESGFVSHFPDLVGLTKIHQKQRIEALPYIVQKANYLVHKKNDPFYKSNQYQTSFGADFKIGVGSNFNLDVTVNPDFGQVEVDPAVVNLSAFETFYEEKRPFFIEGQNTFNFGNGGLTNNWSFNFGNPQLFYSRRIGREPQGRTSSYDFIDRPRETRILGAAKLTGKFDDTWSLGVLSAGTERTYATIENNGIQTEEEIEPFTHYGVLRSQKQFNNGNQALGFMLTSVNRDLRNDNLKNSLAKQAYTFGVDGWSFLDTANVYVLSGYVVGSYVNGTMKQISGLQKESYRYFQRPDATFATLDTNRTSLSGIYSKVTLSKQKGDFYINASLGTVTPGFENNDLGFQWSADKIYGHLVLGYRWFKPGKIFRRKFLYGTHSRIYDYEGNLSNNLYMLYTYVELMNYYGISFDAWYYSDYFSKNLTRGGPLVKSPGAIIMNLSLSSDRRKDFVYRITGGYLKDNLDGYSRSIKVKAEWKPNTQLSLSFEPMYRVQLNTRQWVGNFNDPLAKNTFGKRYVFSDLEQESISASIRMNWSFTPTLSLQLYLQPLFAIGKYSHFKELAKPKTMLVNNYGENGSTITYNSQNKIYEVDPDGQGSAEPFTFRNPDFNFKSLRGTVVLRWEVLPGSIFYLVWTQDRVNYLDPGELSFGRDFSNLLDSESNNIFLAKFSYWLDF
jgi:hypothetical protein